MRSRRLVFWGLLAIVSVLTIPRTARAEDTPDAFARVLVDSADLRTGPGVSYRVLYTAHRGETLALDERGVAVAVQGEVVPRSEWSHRTLSVGDRVEVVRAVQGG